MRIAITHLFSGKGGSMELVLIETFDSKLEAQGLFQLLEQNDIPFIQQSEDAGGKLGSLVIVSGVKVYVHKNDAERVRALMASTN